MADNKKYYRLPYNPAVLAQVTRYKVGVVGKALQIFGLIAEGAH